MKKSKRLLNSKEESPKLGTKEKVSSQDFFGSKKKRGLKKWYIVYLCTTLTTVVAVCLLLLVGVSSNNVPFRESIMSVSLADKVADFFANIDFFGYSGKDSDNRGNDFIRQPDKSASDSDTDSDGKEYVDVSGNIEDLYDYDYSQVPDGCTPIIPMDLSLSSYGSLYINNSTGYSPDIKYLLEKDLKGGGGYVPLSSSSSPVVLIVHTHGTEAYSKDGAKYCEDDTNYARTSDSRQNVLAVGETVSEILNKKGIPTLHCKILHDSTQYKDSYARAEETIKKYLEEYPTIKLVIDVHRDSIVKSTGEIVRPVTELNGEAAAQVMCVVGSDWEGDDCPNWENNLSLALKFREKMNSLCENVCRPVFLKGHTYNQELAPYSMLIEVGSSGNSLEEAQRSATLIAEALFDVVNKI